MGVPARLFKTSLQSSLEGLRACTARTTQRDAVPLAASIASEVPIYEGSQLRQWLGEGAAAVEREEQLMDEWHACLGEGPGVFVVRDMVPREAVDAASRALDGILEAEARGSGGRARGDHFAKAGANSRVWNSFEKLAVADAGAFARYFANPLLDLACQAWLGPGYQLTSQLNVVHPGGQAQDPHRDYHLGFQSAAAAARYPIATQVASQRLTLQGAVAHSDMPLASGPTLLLPFSQLLPDGYLAYRHAEVRSAAEASFVQVPLAKGDGLFFSPALIHAAGTNTTSDVSRAANLLQVSSPFGKPMERVDTQRIIRAVFASARELYESQVEKGGRGEAGGGVTGGGARATLAEVKALVRATASGYAFPANLDTTAPKPDGSMATTEQDLLWEALGARWSQDQLETELAKL
ncbi:PhyH-domain-containing protein [Acaromyces ingoldii]|uniref:PhyH-domain-containing protein n=1 Tax=Acaromyces ingoldii TaxID=215250 RepID=A0A316YCF0_9BASI|nr:PhyH-domain-containing protein [Acaromyces ingoldii]PWN86564.1 PhyH-domain-containing protein [Acaromyces ingoldii]